MPLSILQNERPSRSYVSFRLCRPIFWVRQLSCQKNRQRCAAEDNSRSPGSAASGAPLYLGYRVTVGHADGGVVDRVRDRGRVNVDLDSSNGGHIDRVGKVQEGAGGVAVHGQAASRGEQRVVLTSVHSGGIDFVAQVVDLQHFVSPKGWVGFRA